MRQVRAANQRVLDLPRSAQVPRIALFRYTAAEQQAGMSGKVRRQLLHFSGLWYWE